MDSKLLQEEAQREALYENLKTGVKADVNAEVENRAAVENVDSSRIENLAEGFRGKAIDEIVETDREVERARGLARVSQIVDYIFYVIYGMLGLRLLPSFSAAARFSTSALTSAFTPVFRSSYRASLCVSSCNNLLSIVVGSSNIDCL